MVTTAAFVLSLLALAVSIAALIITIRASRPQPVPLTELPRPEVMSPGKLILPRIVIADDENPEEAAERISKEMATIYAETTLRPRSGRRSAQAKDAV